MLGLLLAMVAPAASMASPQYLDAQRASEEEMCRVQACQHDLHVSLRAKDGSLYDRTFPVFPAIVQPYGIVVAAGQTVHVEAEVSQGALVHLVAVDEVAHPDRTITASLTQTSNGMMLSVSNPFAGRLKFAMGIMPLDQQQLFKTSSCPIEAGKRSFELWPYPIFQVVLGGGHLSADKATTPCE